MQMQILAGIGTFTLILVGGAVGLRLLLLARRTRQLPEFLIGGALFGFAGIAQPMNLLAGAFAKQENRSATLACIGLSLLAAHLTHAGMAAFNRLVFRREEAWALVAASTLSAASFASVAYVVYIVVVEMGPAAMQQRIAARMACFAGLGFFLIGWTGVESFRYYGLMRKRMTLGLADPVLTNRFFVWGLGCSTTAVSSFVVAILAYQGANLAEDPVVLLVVAGSGIITSIGWYLSFLAPASYQRWVRARSEATGAEA